MIFIDWVSAVMPCQHTPDQLCGDRVVKINSDGEKLWESRSPTQLEGSYSSSVRIKSHDGGRSLYISCNPTKVFQGHNAFGHWSPHDLAIKTFNYVVEKLNLTPTIQDYKEIKAGNYRFTRLDITAMFDIDGTGRAVNEWIRNAEFTSRTRAGRPALKSGTIYWGGGENSRFGVKAYNKQEEMEKNHKDKKGKKVRELPPKLIEWVEGKLRLEVQLNKKELECMSGSQENKSKAYFWTKYEFIESTYNHYIEKLQLNNTGEVMKKSYWEILSLLPKGVRNTYVAWEAGIDIQSTMANGTFYRHRKIIQECVGVDITFHREHSRLAEKSNVVPLVRVLEAKPSQPPKECLKGFVVGY